MGKFTPTIWLSSIALLALAFSCATTGTRLAVSFSEEDRSQLAQLEGELLQAKSDSSRQKSKLLADKVDRLLDAGAFNKEFLARLWGIEGEAALDAGRIGQAKLSLAEIRRLNSREARGFTLAARLESDPSTKVDALIKALGNDATDEPEWLNLELANTLFELGKNREAAAAYDLAFARLPADWVGYYQTRRDEAYANKDSLAAVSDRVLTLETMIGIVQNETRFFDVLRIEKAAPFNAVLQRLTELGFFRTDSPDRTEQQTRGSAALFLLRLVAKLEGKPNLLDRPAGSAASPIPDTPVASPFFRPAVELVQRDILDLPDGVNFMPGQPISAFEFLGALKNMKKLYPR